jgi:hypothetical protein
MNQPGFEIALNAIKADSDTMRYTRHLARVLRMIQWFTRFLFHSAPWTARSDKLVWRNSEGD